MASQANETLQQLETRVRQLILQYKDLQGQIVALQGEVAQRDQRIGELEQANKDVAAQYANLKMARMLALSDSDTRDARQRLSHLVREVDKCIALLKS